MCDVLRSPTYEPLSNPLSRGFTQLTTQPMEYTRLNTYNRQPTTQTLEYTRVNNRQLARLKMPELSTTHPETTPSNEMLKYKGKLQMEVPGVKQRTKIPVSVSIYSTPFDQYAVISQERLLCKDCGYISLKNCAVRQSKSAGNYCFQISCRSGDRPPVTFHCNNDKDLRDWVSIIEQYSDIVKSASPKSPRTHPLLSLSALEEEDEEKEE